MEQWIEVLMMNSSVARSNYFTYINDNNMADAEIRDRFAPPLTDPKTRSKVPYNYALEWLRGLAALWVAYAHVFGFERQLDPAYHPSSTLHLYSHAAHGGILIFFALSGYVIGLTNQAPFSRANALRYLLRRFIRLYPIYAISIALAVLVSPHDTWKTVIGNLLFLQGPVAALLPGNGVLWTLNYEVVYYLAFLAIWYFRPKIAPLVCGTFIVACLGWFIPSFPQTLGGYAAGWLFWLFGLWLAWKRPPAESLSKAPLFAYLLLFIANDRLQPLAGFLNSLGFHNPGHSIVNLTDLSYFPVGALVFAAVANRPFSSWRPLQVIAFGFPLAYSSYLLAVGDLFENIVWIICSAYILLAFALVRWRIQPKVLNVFAFIGSISYGIYVLHMPMMHLVHNSFLWSGSPWSFTLRLLVWVALTIGLSWWLELKLQPVLKRWFQQSILDRIYAT